MSEKRYGRWATGDIAERKSDGKLFQVTGFILDPAVCFRAIIGNESFVEVADCLNDKGDLIHYKKENDDGACN